MKQLTDSGLIKAEKDGKWVYYSRNCARMEILREFIAEVNKIGNEPNCCGVADCHN